MDYTKIQTKLKDYNKNEVLVFINYLRDLETSKDRTGQLKNKWFPYFKEEAAIYLYKQVAIDGLYIDGDTITLSYKGKVMVSYNYQAYKNKLLMIYPEASFDIQNVFKEDTFSFKKESGKVIYTHNINDPFNNKKEIIGCYCIIKTNRGEFIETLNRDEIDKIRSVAKTQSIWNQWEGEMVLKSVIKRACKRHFKDVVSNIEKIDNENYDLENTNIDISLKEEIQNCNSKQELTNIYNAKKTIVEDEVEFINLLNRRLKEVENESL